MSDPTVWVNRLAAELSSAAPTVPVIDAAAVGTLLRIAREVAHGSERLNAPLSTYAAGRHIAARMAAGVDETVALAEVEEAVRRVLAEPSS